MITLVIIIIMQIKRSSQLSHGAFRGSMATCKTGKCQVTLVHCNEAIKVLQRVTNEQSDRKCQHASLHSSFRICQCHCLTRKDSYFV
ncbi:uncharacterized [Lates japonicus]